MFNDDQLSFINENISTTNSILEDIHRDILAKFEDVNVYKVFDDIIPKFIDYNEKEFNTLIDFTWKRHEFKDYSKHPDLLNHLNHYENIRDIIFPSYIKNLLSENSVIKSLINGEEFESIDDKNKDRILAAFCSDPIRSYLSEYFVFDQINEILNNLIYNKTSRDSLFEEAARIVVIHQSGSPALLQRKLKLGYNRAGKIIDELESVGIVGGYNGSKPREVYITNELELEEKLGL